jgi:hypothetical protein
LAKISRSDPYTLSEWFYTNALFYLGFQVKTGRFYDQNSGYQREGQTYYS